MRGRPRAIVDMALRIFICEIRAFTQGEGKCCETCVAWKRDGRSVFRRIPTRIPEPETRTRRSTNTDDLRPDLRSWMGVACGGFIDHPSRF